MRRLSTCVVFALLFLSRPPEARGKDDDPLRLRLFEVGALTTGVPSYVPERVGTVLPDAVNDEECPIFGAEMEEPVLPFGSVDELIELVKASVDPTYWYETQGTDIKAQGTQRLVVFAKPSILESVARFLAGLESEALTSVTVEIVAVRAAADDSQKTPEQLAGEASGPRLLLTALDRQQATAFTGLETAYVQDYDTEVAQSSKVSDPIVGVGNMGLGVAVRPAVGGLTDAVLLQAQVAIASLTEFRESAREGDHVIELPQCSETRVRTDVIVPAGKWVRLEGASGEGSTGWVFLVRATPLRAAPAVDPAPLLFAKRAVAGGPVSTQRFDLSDLELRIATTRAPWTHLWPSNFTPPEPPELPEPTSPLPSDVVVDLMRIVVGGWDTDEASLEIRNGWLFVRQSEEGRRAVAATLQGLRKQVLWSVETTAEVVTVAEEKARGLGDVAREGYLLDEQERAQVLGWEGARVERLHLTCREGTRTALTTGREVFYLKDYDVEIAEASNIPNPILGKVLSGTALDMDAAVTAAGDAANVGVRFVRSAVEEPLRKATTPHGPVDAPRMALTNTRTNLRIPFGRTAIVASGTDAGRTTVLLLTPRLVRPE